MEPVYLVKQTLDYSDGSQKIISYNKIEMNGEEKIEEVVETSEGEKGDENSTGGTSPEEEVKE